MSACRQCEADNATLHRDLSAALELVLNHKLHLQVGAVLGAGGWWMGGWRHFSASHMLLLPLLLPQSKLKSAAVRVTATHAQLQQEAGRVLALTPALAVA